MSEKEFLLWLKRERLLDTVKSSYPVFKKVLQDSLKPSGEKILMIGDFGEPDRRVSPILLGCYLMAAKELKKQFEIKVSSLEAPNNEIADSLHSLDDHNSIVAVMSRKFGNTIDLGKPFRGFVKEHKHRFITTPGLAQLSTTQFNNIVQAIQVDYNELYERGQVIKKAIDSANEIFVHTDQGTELYVNVRGMPGINNSGLYEEKGLGGNIPAGEVYCAPNLNHVEGKVVIDGSIRTIDNTIILDEPITLFFEKGICVEMTGKRAHILEASLKWAEDNTRYPHGVRRFAELGIGTNPKASICGSTVINEKTLGTAHIALGSNAWFGGSIYAVSHLDHVFKNPQFEFDGEKMDF